VSEIIIAQSNRGAPDPIGLHNIEGSQINPATEDTLQDLLECLGCQSGTDILTEIQSILAQLDVALSTRASEATLLAIATDLALVKADIASIDASIDVNLSTVATEATLLLIHTLINSINTKLDVNLSTRASEFTLQAVKDAVDGLEGQLTTIISRLDVDLSTRASELTLQAVLDALGEESGTNVLLELQDIDSTLNSGLDIRLHDKDGNGITSTALSGGLQALDVNIVGGDYEFEVVGIKDSANNRIDPATEDTLIEVKDYLDTVETKLQSILDQLDVALSTRASESTLVQVRDYLDTVETKLQTIIDGLDVNLSTRASEVTLQAVLDALGEASGTDLLTELQSVLTALNSIDGKIDVNLSTRASEATLQSLLDTTGEESGATVLSKLQEIIDGLSAVTTYEVVGIKDSGDNRIDPATEPTLEEVRDAVGQASGTSVIDKLIEIWNGLVAGLAKFKIWDGTYQADVTVDNRLKVEALLSHGSGIENVVQIEDGLGSQKRVRVDDSNRFWVATPPPEAPPGTNSVINTGYSDVATVVDDVYIVPNGEIILVQRMSAGAEQDSSFGSAVELWYDPLGTGVGMTIIDVIFANGNSDQHDLNTILTGDGTKAIRMRRIRFSGGAKFIFGRWEGYY